MNDREKTPYPAALLFDLDGTLANTDPLHLKAWQRCLKSEGIDVDEPFYATHITGRTTPEAVRHLFPQLDEAGVQEFAAYKERTFRQLAEGVQPVAGLVEVLHWAAEHRRHTALVTNGSRENVSFMLKELGLEHEFEVRIYGEELHVGKPDPLPYRLALEQLRMGAAQSVAFEDSPTGVRASAAAGIRTVGIATTQTEATLAGAGAERVVKDFTDPRLWELLR